MVEIESFFLQLLISTSHRNIALDLDLVARSFDCCPKHAYMGTESPTPPAPKKETHDLYVRLNSYVYLLIRL